MSEPSHSFIDIAALDAVREHFANADAAVILTPELDSIVWANGPGSNLLGFPVVEDAIGSASGLGAGAIRQIKATRGYPQIAPRTGITVRLAAGMLSQTMTFEASSLDLPGGEPAIMLVVPRARKDDRSEAETAALAIDRFGDASNHLAIVAATGETIAATAGIEGVGIDAAIVTKLISEMEAGGGRVLKRIQRIDDMAIPVGLARLRSQPPRYLLVTVDDRADAPAIEPDTAPERAEPPYSRPRNVTIAYDTTGDITDVAESIREPAADVKPVAAPRDLPIRISYDDEAADETAVIEQDNLPGTAVAVADTKASPRRFVWLTDSDGRFRSISPEFLTAVGIDAGDIVGQTFEGVAERFGLDPDGAIAGLLARRDTWSGRSVLWPIAGTSLRAPVDLAALPTYGRDRTFEGFRGFGVIRVAEAVAHEAVAEEPRPTPAEAKREEAPAPQPEGHDEPPQTYRAEKVVQLSDRRTPVADRALPDRVLSPVERSAFQEIGKQLKRRDDAVDTTGPSTSETGGQTPASDESEPTIASEDGPVARVDDSQPVQTIEDAPDPETPAELPEAVEAIAPEQAPVEAFQHAAKSLLDYAAEPIETPAQPTGPAIQRTGFVPSAFAERAGTARGADTSILSQLPVPVLVYSGDALHYANPAFLELTGYETLEDFRAHGGLDAILSGPGSEDDDSHVAMKTKSGEEVPVGAHLRSVPWNGGKALMLTLTRPAPAPPPVDNSRELYLEARVDELRAILDTATDGVIMIHMDGDIRSVSRPAEALFGYDSVDLVGQPFAHLFAIESQKAATEYLESLSNNGVASVLNDGREVIGREAQGRFIPLFMTIGKLPANGGYCAVLRDITQWKRAEEDLTQARAQAERTSSQKSDFLARVSHEIRTPLNAIIGFSELMLDEKFGPVANDRYRDYLRDINRSGNHVLDLVNDLLDISKIEAGQQEMDYEAVALNDALTEAVAMMQPQANRERVIIRSSFATKLPEVVADLRSIRQIALNILSNAVRFTQAGGQVIISTSYEGTGEVVIRVRDTGIGMSAAEIEQALKPFKQLNSLKRARGDGTGLGLPLTKAMVEANRAKFSILSSPGEGTLVEVAFPSTRVLAH